MGMRLRRMNIHFFWRFEVRYLVLRRRRQDSLDESNCGVQASIRFQSDEIPVHFVLTQGDIRCTSRRTGNGHRAR